MIEKPLDAITEADLQQLLGRVGENRRLEYKANVADTPQGKGGLLKAVCALANTQGGDIVVGIVTGSGEERHLAKEVRGVEVRNLEQEVLAIEQAIRTGLEPPIGDFRVHPVPLKTGLTAFVVRVFRSWRNPHRTVGSRKFYYRTSMGTDHFNVDELRRAFLISEGQADGIRSFVASRRLAVSRPRSTTKSPHGEYMVVPAGALPVPLRAGARVLLHVIPLGSLEPGAGVLSIGQIKALCQDVLLPITGDGGCPHRPTLEGLAVWHGEDSLVTMYRSGIIEAVDTRVVTGGAVRQRWMDAPRIISGLKDVIPSRTFEGRVTAAVGRYMRALKRSELSPPAFLFLQLSGVREHRMALPEERGGEPSPVPFGRDVVGLPEVVIDEWDRDPIEYVRPLFDMLWNAVGVETG